MTATKFWASFIFYTFFLVAWKIKKWPNDFRAYDFRIPVFYDRHHLFQSRARLALAYYLKSSFEWISQMFILQLGKYSKLWWSSESSQISEPTISATLLSGRKFIRHLEAFLGSKFVIGSDLIHSYQAEGSTIDSSCYSGLLAGLDMLLTLNGWSSFNYEDYTLKSVLWEETLDSWWLMKDLLEGLEEECSNKPCFESSSSSWEFHPLCNPLRFPQVFLISLS